MWPTPPCLGTAAENKIKVPDPSEPVPTRGLTDSPNVLRLRDRSQDHIVLLSFELERLSQIDRREKIRFKIQLREIHVAAVNSSNDWHAIFNKCP